MTKSLQDILINERISDFLAERGIKVEKVGSRMRCLCPLHGDSNPSFYIGQFPDGADYFKCFGCDISGNLITLISLLNGTTSKKVVKDLCDKHGIKLEYGTKVVTEPLPYEIVAAFCEEDLLASDISTLARNYLRSRHGCADAVNKVSRLYLRLDKLNAEGDMRGMTTLMGKLKELLAKEGQRKNSFS
jgi:DNA primase